MPRRTILGCGFLVAAAFAGVTARPAVASEPATVPIVRQALRNNCETAALSMLLAARHVRVTQLRLQRELPQDGPLDPVWRGGVRVWGDPSRGYVGRAAGGGVAGGYGVYQWPLAALAASHGVPLRNLSGGSVDRIYRSLRQGRPVLAWVALSSGPFQRWQSPDGRTIVANFGEHTVVLTGLHGEFIHVNDPIDGMRKLWTRSAFEAMWRAMGLRALGL